VAVPNGKIVWALPRAGPLRQRERAISRSAFGPVHPRGRDLRPGTGPGGCGHNGYMMGYGYGMGAGGWILMSLSAIALWALVVVAVVAVIRAVGRSERPPEVTGAPTATAERTLAERFARGDIDAEEYQRRLIVLRVGGS
jgi:putative membrane protein